MENSLEIFKSLGDKTRLEIMRILKTKDGYVELIASMLGLTPGTVSFHLKKLEAAGLVRCSRSQFYMIYSANFDILNKKIGDYISNPAKTDGDDKYKEQVISNFIEYGRLKTIPSQLKKREIIWEYIVNNFEFDRDYTEHEVNDVILRYHDDFCTIRREFICSGFMARDHEIYRRIR